ncbi:MAG TPA: hypothetical protein VFV96_11715 [Verrucomicrobiae bacterium]|nr:hypothetical protein [Verrucomicrobiae bacterium]
MTFTTFGQPYSATLATQPIATTNATLNGMVTPRGLETVGWFEWGPDRSYSQTTSPVLVGSSSNVVFVSAPIEGLLPNANYRCRLVASNSAGITYGWERRFTTGRRVASWGDALYSLPGSVLPPSDLGNVVNIAAGDYHGMALRADGTLAIWGDYLSVNGPLTVLPATSPNGLSNLVAIAGGRSHSLAINRAGKVVAWGLNYSGQTNVPATLSNVVAISAGDAHSLALRNNGTLASWGDIPTALIPFGLSNVVAISSGDTFCVALKNTGSVAVWGNASSSKTSIPVGLSNVVAIAAGYGHILALKSDGTVVAWGLGAGINVPPGLSNVVAIAAGDYHSLALRSDGTVVPWGIVVANTYPYGGFLQPPTGLTDVVGVCCGDEYCLALASNTQPQPVAQTMTGPLNQDLILSLPPAFRDPNGDVLTNYRIAAPPASGMLYQFDSGARGAAITESNALVSDALARVVFSPGVDESGAPYSNFSVIASDGEFDSAPSLVTVNIVPSPTIFATISDSSSNRAVSLSFAGLSNATYRVWASTNLVDWTWIARPSQPLPGQFLYSDASVTNRPLRFFRVTSP